MTPYEYGIYTAMKTAGFGGALLQAGKALAPKLLPAAKTLGKDMLIGGAIGAGVNAAMAQPGQRLQAAKGGLMSGALGGAVYRGVHAGTGAVKGLAPVQGFMSQGGMGRSLLNKVTHPAIMGTAASMLVPQGMPKPNPVGGAVNRLQDAF